MSKYSQESQFDKQGAYFWSLVKQAGWTRMKAESLMLKKYRKTHWNILDDKEKRQMIAVLKKYVVKAESEKSPLPPFKKGGKVDIDEKGFRQRIMALWSKTGHTKDELHDLMVQWRLEPSLRACGYPQLCFVWRNVKAICGNNV